MSSNEVVIVSGVRTAIGTYGGALKSVAPTDMAAAVAREAVSRAGVAPQEIGHCVFGNVLHSDHKDLYLSRYAAVEAGLPVETPALTLNRLCGSGLQAVVSAAQIIMLGDAEIVVAGGAENMSRMPYWAHDIRWGKRMGDSNLEDAMIAALHDPFHGCHMGVTAENVAGKWGISREDQDTLAFESHQRAVSAISQGRFRDQILPVEIKSRKGVTVFDQDEHPRADTTIEKLAEMRPVFQKDGTVTAGNASGINDAAAAVVMMSADRATQLGIAPRARLVGYSHAGVEPELMGIGPIPAIRKLLDKTGLSVSDMDVVELNEAFAAQALAVVRDLNLTMDKTNPNGSGISLGHPIGATGCVLTVKAIHELERIGGRYGLISMCIGGGQGIAAIIENIQ